VKIDINCDFFNFNRDKLDEVALLDLFIANHRITYKIRIVSISKRERISGTCHYISEIDQFISGIFNISAKSEFYQRKFKYISERAFKRRYRSATRFSPVNISPVESMFNGEIQNLKMKSLKS